MITRAHRRAGALCRLFLLAAALCLILSPCRGDIIWSDLGETLAHQTGAGVDILGGAVRRDDSASDALYFKFHVNPISDAGTEPYLAAFELFEGDTERLAVGNALNAWAYGAFNVAEVGKTNFNVFETGKTNNVPVDYGIDLNSSKPTAAGRGGYYEYELPRKGIERTIVFKVQFVPGGKDEITAWLDPDLGPGATESSQPTNLTTKFLAKSSFNQIRLRHEGRGDGWIFSEMAIATSFNDFVLDGSGQPSVAGGAIRPSELPFSFRVWQREQGLPQNFVRALAQTKDGYMWIGSDAGVSRFDGVRFVSFGLPEGFLVGPAQVLLGDTHGALWIGSAGRGLGRWQNGHFTTFTTQNGLPSDSVNALSEDGEGRIWIGTEGGLGFWRKNHLETYPQMNGKAVVALCHGDDATWIGIKGEGVFRMQNGSVKKWSDEPFLNDPHCLLVDREHRLWVGAGQDSIFYQDLSKPENPWRHYRFPRHLARHYMSALAEDPDGTVWAGSVSEGLFQFKHGKLVAVNASSGLSDSLVEALLVDREGKIWVGTHGGLNRLRPKNVSVISSNEGLGKGAVQGLAEVAPGLIWASKASEGIFAWDGRYFTGLQAEGLSPQDGSVGPLLAAKDGSCWVAGPRGLLQFQNPREAETNAGLPALTNLEISALAEDSKGRIWAGTRQGELWWKDNDKWHSQKNEGRTHAITSIAPAPGDIIWVGTAGDGLFRASDRADGRWQKRQGLLSDWIRTLLLDSHGNLWVGTGGGGLSRLRSDSLATFTMHEGLPDNTISQILEDGNGNLWLGGDRGIVRVSEKELDDVSSHKIPAGYPEVYGRNEGMLSEECISGFFPLGLKTRSGLLWFPTQEGVAVADPNHLAPPIPPPAVVLEEMLVDGVPVTADSLHLGPGKHRLEFRYTGLDFDAPERVRFRYRLEGLVPEWVEAGSSRSASFPYVPYGNYRFEVVAGNGQGNWTTSGASVEVFVKPYLWQTWWFRIPAAVGLIALIAVAARVAEKRKLQRRLEQLEKERALARERERIARDLHDDLGSSLARISLLSGLLKADRDNSQQIESHAIKISQSADQTVRALEEIVWAVRPGSDTLQSLVEYIAHFANELFDGTGIHCRLDLPLDLPARPLPPDVRHNVFLVVKEALTNAVKHAGAKEVFVQARATEDSLELLVQDNGKGFNPANPKRGQGLENMRRRAQANGEQVDIQTAPGKGTTVRIKLHFAPVHSNGRAVA